MTFTYTPGQLEADSAEGRSTRVRFAIGDTFEEGHLSENEEIDYALAVSSNDEAKAAALIADSIAARFEAEMDVSVGSYSEKAGERASRYRKLAERLRVVAGLPGGGGNQNAPLIMKPTDTAPYFRLGAMSSQPRPEDLPHETG